MEENPQNENQKIKKGFFKKIWYSIYKIEKYSELSAEGFGKAIKYLIILVVILSFMSSGVTVYRTSLDVKNIAQYINEKSPELSYSNETLTLDSQEPIIDDWSSFGKIIVDTNTEDTEKVNQYLNDVKEEENAVIILKDRMILKEIGLQGTTNYKYSELFGQMGIAEFKKQDLVGFLTGSGMMSLYFNLLMVLFIYSFVIYFINTIFNIIIISIFGYFTTMILRLKIRYVAIFNMALYSITLPTILDMVYIGINAFYRYTINYFDVMYVLISSIYMIASIFILKSDFNKKQGEVQRIVEVQKEIKEETEEKKKEEHKKEDNKKNRDTGKNNKKEDEEDTSKDEGEAPEAL